MRVFNITSGDRPRLNQAKAKVRDGLIAWVEYGVTVRTLTLAEQIQARNEIARLREPLSPAEVPGVIYEPSVSGREAYRMGRQMVLDATAMCAGYYHPVSA